MSKKEQPKDSFDAFNSVDKLVSKPILGSDGAASWQEFRTNNSKVYAQQTSNAPKAPLKKVDKIATGFTSWNEERKQEEDTRREAGAAALNEGYTHFKKKDDDIALRKERARIEQRIRPDDKEYFIKAKTFEGFTFDYIFTTRETYGTGYYWEGSDSLKQLKGALPAWAQKSKKDNEKEEDEDENTTTNKRPTADSSDVKSKKKKRKKSAPVIVSDPNNPLEQVQEAIRKRNERLGLGTGNDDLPEGWEAPVDPSSGKTYYYCRQTNETRWTKPPKEVPLPDGWSVAKTNDGKQYYYHSSGETRWERPSS